MGNAVKVPVVWAAVGWTALYVASKVHLALEERLGVMGGPRVAADSYRDYGPGEVAQAQWANAVAGALIVGVLVAALFTARHRWPRRILLALLAVCTAMAAAGAIGMLGGAIFTERGGAVFGGYCAVWAVLLFLAGRDVHRRRAA